jgi:hypothetical protein
MNASDIGSGCPSEMADMTRVAVVTLGASLRFTRWILLPVFLNGWETEPAPLWRFCDAKENGKNENYR